MERSNNITFPREDRGANGTPLESSSITQFTTPTRSTLSILTESFAVPMSVEKAKVRRKQTVDEIGNASIHHPSLLEQDFEESQLDAVEFSRLLKPAFHSGHRWVSIATDYAKADIFAEDIINLLRKLRDIWMEKEGNGQSINRLLDTRKKQIPQDRNPKPRPGRLAPDLFFEGTGSLFPTLPSTGKPSWNSCIALGDAKLIKGKDDHFGQLATYAEQVFSAQENRRFLHTFYINQTYFVWCTFDRGGSRSGGPCVLPQISLDVMCTGDALIFSCKGPRA